MTSNLKDYVLALRISNISTPCGKSPTKAFVTTASLVWYCISPSTLTQKIELAVCHHQIRAFSVLGTLEGL